MTADQIIEAVCEVTGVERKWITGEGLPWGDRGSRPEGWRDITRVDARRMASVAIVLWLGSKLSEAGKACGNTHHSTVIHHLKRHRDLMGTDLHYAEKWGRVRATLAMTDEDRETACVLHFMEQYEEAKTVSGRQATARAFYRNAYSTGRALYRNAQKSPE